MLQKDGSVAVMRKDCRRQAQRDAGRSVNLLSNDSSVPSFTEQLTAHPLCAGARQIRIPDPMEFTV